MPNLTLKTSHLTEAYSRLLEQFKGNVQMREMLRTWVAQVQELETAAFQVINGRHIDAAEGVQLDGIGQIVGQPREGADDATYRLRLRARVLINLSSGTLPEILQIFDLLIASDQTAIITEYFPASFALTVGGTSGTTTEVATELARILEEVSPAGVGQSLVYAEDADANIFTFASGDVEEASATQGWNGAAGDPIFGTTANTAVDNRWVAAAFSPTLGSGSGRIVAISDTTGTNQVMTSDDGGASWTARNAASARTWEDVVWAPSLALFVAVASDGTLGGRCMTSPDGITWTSRTMPDGAWSSIAWSSSLGRFAVVGRSVGPSYACTSTDGTTWTTSGVTQVGGYWSSVTDAGSSGFVAVGQFDTGNGQAMFSTTGLNWSVSGVTVPEANQWTSVAYSPDNTRLAAVSKDGTNQVMTSDNGGVTWTARAEAAANQWLSVVWSDSFDRFVAVSQDGTNRIMLSETGASAWSSLAAPATKEWCALVDCPLNGKIVSLALADTTDAVMLTSAAESTNTGGKFADVATV